MPDCADQPGSGLVALVLAQVNEFGNGCCAHPLDSPLLKKHLWL